MHKQTKATNIAPKVREAVWERDGQCCIICKDHHAAPNSHIVRRSQGGMGIAMNIVTHCQACHFKFDNYDTATRAKTYAYIKEKYPDWTEESVKYSKWRD